MTFSFSKVAFYSLIAILISITTVALPEVQAVGSSLESTTSNSSEGTGFSIDFAADYTLSSLDVDDFKVLERLQKSESKKIEDELERIRIQKEKERREAEERARLAALQAQKRKTTVQQSRSTVSTERVQGDFEGAIRSKCAVYGCNASQVIRVMYCESGGRSNAVGGIHKGLFQFNPNTFRANAARKGISNSNIWNPWQQIDVATWMFANGQAWQWSCA